MGKYCSEFTSRMDMRVTAARNKRQQMTRSLSHNDAQEDDDEEVDNKVDGNTSDSGLGSGSVAPSPMSLKRRSSLVYKVAAIMGLTKKSRSASQLNLGEHFIAIIKNETLKI